VGAARFAQGEFDKTCIASAGVNSAARFPTQAGSAAANSAAPTRVKTKRGFRSIVEISLKNIRGKAFRQRLATAG